MIWHIVTQVGSTDTFSPQLAKDDARLELALDKPGHPNRVVDHLLSGIHNAGLNPRVAAVDLLNFAVAAYCADLRVPRILSQDRWQRHFKLYLPVRSPDQWAGASSELSRLLSYLTGDLWELRFRELPSPPNPKLGNPDCIVPSRVCLFSGGLDSYVGALDLLKQTSDRIALVGHHGSGSTFQEQRRAYDSINIAYPNRAVPFWFFVQPKKLAKDQIEDTMRSRSILFLALGAAVASSLGGDQITLSVPENGLISLNVPLTDARAGSLSTRTTHPHVLRLFQTVLEKLSIPVTLETPFKFLTKGEMLANCSDKRLLAASASGTMSCSRPSAGRYQHLTPGKHCGYCVPCIIRRAAMKVVNLDSPAEYSFNVLTDKSRATEPRGRDRRAFAMAIERVSSMSDIEVAAEVSGTGPIPPAELPAFVKVFKRGLAEVNSFFNE
jgi:7-cyano-7-deazaguanine synthase in queuosine biosynthesis